MKQTLVACLVVAAIAFLLGYQAAPKEILDQEATYVGPSSIDTRQVLSATVESLKAESRLVSYKYTGTTSVSVARDKWVIFEGHQTLSVPATVSYFVDLSLIKDSDVSFDEARQEIAVYLPRLMLTVSFDPQRAIEINEGSLTFNDAIVQELRKLNYETARRAVIKQAQQAELIRLAKEQARNSVASFFRIPLRVAGKDDVQVRVVFRSDAT